MFIYFDGFEDKHIYLPFVHSIDVEIHDDRPMIMLYDKHDFPVGMVDGSIVKKIILNDEVIFRKIVHYGK